MQVWLNWSHAMYTPPHQCKAYINLNVSKPLMVLNLALSAFILAICARSPTYRYFIKLGFFLGSCQSTAHCSERQRKRFYCFSRRESLEEGDEWGHQLNKPSVLSCCPRLYHSASSALFSSTEHTSIYCIHIQPPILEYMNPHAPYINKEA